MPLLEAKFIADEYMTFYSVAVHYFEVTCELAILLRYFSHSDLCSFHPLLDVRRSVQLTTEPANMHDTTISID